MKELRACSDTLPTPVNLARWKIQAQPSCALCGSANATVKHILNGCPTALSDGRYTWRHDSILLELTRQLKESMAQAKDDTGAEVYADLDQLRASENPPGTIPCQLVVTTARPDLVAIKGNVIRILELTVCTNSREAMSNARTRKLSKISYQQLLGDLERQGKDVRYITMEMGALGHYPGDLVVLMSEVFPEIRKKCRNILDQLSKVSINCSQMIYFARNSEHWLH